MTNKNLILIGILIIGIVLVSACIDNNEQSKKRNLDGLKVVHSGDQAVIYVYDKFVDNITLKEIPDGTKEYLIAHNMTKVEWIEIDEAKRDAERVAELDNLFDFAKKDSNVQELIEGKNYVVGASHRSEGGGTDLVLTSIEVEGEWYIIAMDMNDNKTVKSIKLNSV